MKMDPSTAESEKKNISVQVDSILRFFALLYNPGSVSLLQFLARVLTLDFNRDVSFSNR